jgi:hypothetical protein
VVPYGSIEKEPGGGKAVVAKDRIRYEGYRKVLTKQDK